MTSDGFLFLAANVVAVANLLLFVYRAVLVRKSDYLTASVAGTGLDTAVYALATCWSSVVYNVFVAFCDWYNAKFSRPSMFFIIGLCVLGSGLVIWTTGATSLTLKYEDYIPLVSMIFYTIFAFYTANAAQLKIVEAIDIALWIVYDYTHFLIINMVLNVFLVIVPFAEYYVIRMQRKAAPAKVEASDSNLNIVKNA